MPHKKDFMQDEIAIASDAPVLVVDDVMSARMVLSDMLMDLGFSNCIEARNGHEALQLLERHNFQLVFCDYLMDGMSGPDFLLAVQSRSSRLLPPVIFVSSMGDVQSVDEVLKIGASDYIIKPVNLRKLRQKVEAVLNPSRTGAV
jgi:two-component system chemotaxis response regulator CheY